PGGRRPPEDGDDPRDADHGPVVVADVLVRSATPRARATPAGKQLHATAVRFDDAFRECRRGDEKDGEDGEASLHAQDNPRSKDRIASDQSGASRMASAQGVNGQVIS